jgi:hypothetical protein
MLIERYRGKTRVMMPDDHRIAVDARENGKASKLYQWLSANTVGGWRYKAGVIRKDDTRDFLSITFDDDADAHLFRMKHQEPGDVTVSDKRYTTLTPSGYFKTLKEHELHDTERQKDSICFLGQVDYKRWINADQTKNECYSTKRNVAGYFLCWTITEDGVSNVSASKTKRIMVERARRRHLA